jgi:hypothetical protein
MEVPMDIIKCVRRRIVFHVSKNADCPLDGGSTYRGILKKVLWKGGDIVLVMDDVIYHYGDGSCPYVGVLRLKLADVDWWKEWS